EVVVEAIGDGRADAELGLGIDLLHGLGQDVGGTVAQDRQPVLAGDVDALDMLSVLEPLAEITQLPVDAQGDDLAAALEQLGARGALLDPLLCLVEGDGDLGHGMLLLVGSSLPTMPARFRRGRWYPCPGRARNALGSGRCTGGGRYWVRTSDLFRVREARYRCANRPCTRRRQIRMERTTGFEPATLTLAR